ncbi:MAG: ubiquinol-cytochrome C chaperone family protein [Alphaproteobacteria bacterium]|nr:ubiquinol-cytochrome C chaperone family protein [Alphaproteobacteria bacterium]
MFAFLSKQGRQRTKAARGLYATVMVASRNPAFFSVYNVPDTVEGRFEVLAMHGGVLVNRLSSPEMGSEGIKLAQAFFDVMFRDLDWSLREMGIGDLGVPRRVKKMMSAFKGRAVAYDEALKSGAGDVKHALIRNMYGMAQEISSSKLDMMVSYMQECAKKLADVELADFQQGKVILPELKLPEELDKSTKEECEENGSKEAA